MFALVSLHMTLVAPASNVQLPTSPEHTHSSTYQFLLTDKTISSDRSLLLATKLTIHQYPALWTWTWFKVRVDLRFNKTLANYFSDWASYFLGDNAAISSYGYARQLFTIFNTARGYIAPFVQQVIQKPDLATVALLLIILFVSLKLVNMLYQSVLWWFRMAWNFVFWGGLAALAMWMYTRGPEGAAADMQYWYAMWTGEYQRWKDQERVARLLNQQQGRQGRQAWYG